MDIFAKRIRTVSMRLKEEKEKFETNRLATRDSNKTHKTMSRTAEWTDTNLVLFSENNNILFFEELNYLENTDIEYLEKIIKYLTLKNPEFKASDNVKSLLKAKKIPVSGELLDIANQGSLNIHPLPEKWSRYRKYIEEIDSRFRFGAPIINFDYENLYKRVLEMYTIQSNLITERKKQPALKRLNNIKNNQFSIGPLEEIADECKKELFILYDKSDSKIIKKEENETTAEYYWRVMSIKEKEFYSMLSVKQKSQFRVSMKRKNFNKSYFFKLINELARVKPLYFIEKNNAPESYMTSIFEYLKPK